MPGIVALARFQSRLPGFTLITQNVDGLHQRAGSTDVIELHGNIWRARCAGGCGVVRDGPGPEPRRRASRRGRPAAGAARAARSCGRTWCGSAKRSTNRADAGAATRAAEACEVFLAIGTSALVYPAAGLPLVAGRAGAVVVEINVDDTPLTPHADIVLRGTAAELLPALEARL